MAFLKKRLSATITILFFPILLDFLAKSSAANQSEYHTRVHDGFKAEDGQFPYTVLIVIDEPRRAGVSGCTGSLIQLDLVLTAAHCFESVYHADSVTVMAGKADAVNFLKTASRRIRGSLLLYPQKSVSAQVLRAKKLITHPEYKFDVDETFDLGLARLEKKFTETKFVKTINYVLDTISPDMRCFGMGYGRSDRTGLLYFYRIGFILNATECFGNYHMEHTYCQVFESQHTCEGDSGSPIVCNGSVYAVNSGAIYADYADQECKAPSLKLNINIASAEKSKPFIQIYAKPASPTSASGCITVSQWLTLLIGLKLLVL